MDKFVSGAAVFLMILGMIVSAVEKAGADDVQEVFDVVKVESSSAAIADKRNNEPRIQTLSVEKTEVTNVTEPVLLVATIEEPIVEETVPEKKSGYHTGVLTAR